MIVGIDYGAKLAGTTALAWIEDLLVHVIQSEKKKDADVFIMEFIKKRKPIQVFLDAPLSLPPAFTNSFSQEYFYRQADKELNAMSPMFIGGLTARAMRLKRIIEEMKIQVFETYPAALNRKVLQSNYYKRDAIEFEKIVCGVLNGFNLQLKSSLTSWHQMDAVLALLSSLRYHRNEHLMFGTIEEGQIVI